MREELSAENLALIYRLFGPSSGKMIAEATLPMLPASINAILDAARSEGRAKPPPPADDNHKALVEAATRGRRALDSLRGKYDTGAVADQLKAALAAFQSRREEK